MNFSQPRVLQLFVVAVLVSIGFIGAHLTVKRLEANHAWPHEQGIGYDGIGNDLGWVNVYVNPSSTSYFAATDAIDSWRALHYENVWWLRNTTDVSEVQTGAEVMDRGNTSVFTGSDALYHTLACLKIFDPDLSGRPDANLAFASTIVTDITDQPVGLDDNGFWGQAPGLPFKHSTVCLNSNQPK